MNKCLVHQGDMVMVARKSTDDPSILVDNAWYQKLLMDGKQVYRLIPDCDRVMSVNGTMPDMLNTAEVDECYINNSSGKSFAVISIVPLDEYLRYIRFDKPLCSAAALVTEQYVAQAMHKIADLQQKMTSLGREIERYQPIMDELDRVSAEIDEFSGYIEGARRGDMAKFTYAFGMHPGFNKEYCWRVPEHLVGKIHTGDEVLCEVSNGTEIAVVTRIEQSPSLREHKNIVCLREDA